MPTAAELAAAVREIQERVRRRHPQSAKGEITLADLMPVVHARDAAAAKVAAIGRVNPRAGGPVNAVIQSVKRTIARGLGWFVRDQVEFNRAAIQCIEALLEAHNETNRALAELADRLEGVRAIDIPALKETQQESADTRAHWQQWRFEWERNLTVNQAQFMRAVADLQLAAQQREQSAAADTHDRIAAQHQDYLRALDTATQDIQQKLWADLDRIREEIRTSLETQVHQELRLVRQRPFLPAPANAPATASALDWFAFADKFRGREKDIRQRFTRYVPLFAGRQNVADLGCGRGEFLSLVRGARGIDFSDENVAFCTARGLSAERADLFAWLHTQGDASLGGIFCSQVIEHLEPLRLPELVQLCAQKLQPGAPIVFETPNPECLAIFASHFYIDPTHTRPVPPTLLHFYLTEAGFHRVEVHRLGTAANEFPELAALPEALRQRFFGSLDYAISAVRLGA